MALLLCNPAFGKPLFTISLEEVEYAVGIMRQVIQKSGNASILLITISILMKPLRRVVWPILILLTVLALAYLYFGGQEQLEKNKQYASEQLGKDVPTTIK